MKKYFYIPAVNKTQFKLKYLSRSNLERWIEYYAKMQEYNWNTLLYRF